LQSIEGHVNRLLSQFGDASDVRAVADELSGQQVIDLARAGAFVGALLLAWISMRPFIDLGDMLLTEVTMGNEAWTYAAFAGFAVLTVALALGNGAGGFAKLL